MIGNRRHLPFFVALLAGLVSCLLALWVSPLVTAVVVPNVFFAVFLAFTFRDLRKMTAAYLRKNAAATDEPVWIIFLVTLCAVVASFGSLFIVLNAAQQPGRLELLFALTAIPLGWLTVQVMAAIHYAHMFWQPDRDDSRRHASGLEFPGTRQPDGWDFAYFSFVIGMTAQTSDVQITSQPMRRANMLHAIVSFFFNTVLVAAAVNAAVSIGS